MIEVGSKEAKACKENDILALTKSDYIIHCRSGACLLGETFKY